MKDEHLLIFCYFIVILKYDYFLTSAGCTPKSCTALNDVPI